VKTAAIVLLGLCLLLLGLGIWLWQPDKGRAELEARYRERPEDRLVVEGVTFHLRDRGPREAPAVLLLHGFGSSLHTWEPWVRGLVGSFRVISLDLPGFGLTGPDPSGDYSDERSILLLERLLDQLGLARVSVIGHSMGGRIAWRFAAARPSRVERLVLIAPDGFQSMGRDYGEAPEIPWVMGVMRYTLPTLMVRQSLEPAYVDRSLVTDELVARYRDMMLAPGTRGAILDRMRQAVLADPGPLLPRIEAPVLLVWGEQDRMVPVTNAADYEALLPNARRVTFPDLGHVPQEEGPDRSLGPVREFLLGR